MALLANNAVQCSHSKLSPLSKMPTNNSRSVQTSPTFSRFFAEHSILFTIVESDVIEHCRHLDAHRLAVPQIQP
jgi:hypothetical protein